MVGVSNVLYWMKKNWTQRDDRAREHWEWFNNIYRFYNPWEMRCE